MAAPKRMIALALLGALAALAFLLWPAPRQTVTVIDADGRTLTYSCKPSLSGAETQNRANEAHAFFDAELKLLAQTGAEELQAAMDTASQTGDLTGIRPADDRYKSAAADLIKRTDNIYGCHYTSS